MIVRPFPTRPEEARILDTVIHHAVMLLHHRGERQSRPIFGPLLRPVESLFYDDGVIRITSSPDFGQLGISVLRPQEAGRSFAWYPVMSLGEKLPNWVDMRDPSWRIHLQNMYLQTVDFNIPVEVRSIRQ